MSALEPSHQDLKVRPTRYGWLRVIVGDTPAAVRFDAGRIVEQVIAGPTSLPTSRLAAWVNGPEGEPLRMAAKERLTADPADLARIDAAERAEPSKRTTWGTDMVDLLPASLLLDGAQRLRKPEGFYEEFAALYCRLSAASGKPAVVLAEANGVKVSTVHGWVKVAKALGLIG